MTIKFGDGAMGPGRMVDHSEGAVPRPAPRTWAGRNIGKRDKHSTPLGLEDAACYVELSVGITLRRLARRLACGRRFLPGRGRGRDPRDLAAGHT